MTHEQLVDKTWNVKGLLSPVKAALILALVLVCSTAQAGQRYYTQPIRGRVVYVVPAAPLNITVTHVYRRPVGPPYNPVFDTWRHITASPANKPAITVTKGRVKAVPRYHSTPVAQPVMIYNPYYKANK